MISSEMLAIMFVDLHIVKVSCIDLSDLNH
jgi:hypothetical protein